MDYSIEELKDLDKKINDKNKKDLLISIKCYIKKHNITRLFMIKKGLFNILKYIDEES